MRLAVFGAREGSLGHEVAGMAEGLGAAEAVRTYGISGDEDVIANVNSIGYATNEEVAWSYDLFRFKPTDVFVTVGVNSPATFEDGRNWHKKMWESFETNVMGILNVLQECTVIPSVQSFSAVSSNSAHIARRGSSPYCVSKAALSMGLKVAARERVVPLIYGYEFGLIEGTPMTQASAEQFPGVPLTRMVGAENGLSVREVARVVIGNLVSPTHALNGVMLRLDAGEQ